MRKKKSTKKLAVLLLASALLSFGSITNLPAKKVDAVPVINGKGTVNYGDLNMDGEADSMDAVLILKYDAGIMNLTEEQMTAGELTGDGEVDSMDAVLVLKYDAGMIDSLDPSNPGMSQYTVKFVDWNSSVIKSQTVKKGESADLPAAPTKTGCTFLGWSGNYAKVTKDETVRAVYSDEKNVFVVQSVTGNAGGTVKVLVSVDGNVKICGFDLTVSFDPALQLLSIDDDLDLDVITNAENPSSGIILNYSTTSDRTKKRNIIELTFKVKSTGTGVLPVKLSMTSAKEINGSRIIDTSYVIVNGAVTVK